MRVGQPGILAVLQAQQHARLSLLPPRGSLAVRSRLVHTVATAQGRGASAHYRRRALVHMRSASSSGQGSQGGTGAGGRRRGGTQWQQFKQFWRELRDRRLSKEMYYLRLMWRFGRIVVVGFSIFSLGKLQGSIEYAWNPEGFTKDMLRGSLSVDDDKTDMPVLPSNSKEAQRVMRVVSRLLKAAESILEERVASIKSERANAQLDQILTDRDADDWEMALTRLRSGKWTVVVVNNSSPNAYVTPMVPRHVFVHRGLLSPQVAASDAALAFVLGHEIAHTLLQHGEEAMNLELSVLVGTLALVGTLDPTGALSMAFEGLMGPMFKYMLTLPFSRHHELEADSLGMEICAKACYNPEGAQAFFKSLAKIEKKYGGGSNGWTTTHPRTEDRSELARELAVSDPVTHYHDHCIYASEFIKAKLRKSPLAMEAKQNSLLPGLKSLSAGPLKSKVDDTRLSVELSLPSAASTTEELDVYWLDYSGDPHFWASLNADTPEASCLPLNGAVFALVAHNFDVKGTFTATSSGVTWHAPVLYCIHTTI